jgi:hypothetical protein
VDGDGLAGVDPAERDLLPGDHDYAVGRDAALDGDRVGGRLGWWLGGAGEIGVIRIVPRFWLSRADSVEAWSPVLLGVRWLG